MRVPFTALSRSTYALAGMAGMLVGGPAAAHPMGNFAICHYTRLQADGSGLRVHYVLDMAEIPTVAEKEALDRDHNGTVSAEEKAAYLASKARQLRSGLTLAVDGKPVPLQQTGGEVRLAPGAGGLQTLRILTDWKAPSPASGAAYTVIYHDNNYAERTGWKEIVAVAGQDAVLRDSSAPSADRSHELSVYPPGAIPPHDTEARFTVAPGGAAAPDGGTIAGGSSGRSSAATPRDAFTQAIARRELTPGLVLAGLVIAFMYGALHALSPGHGKTMVAAYLVGSRGTPRHAVLLGAVVTVTHTLGVFALGLVTLFASRYVVPERLYPVLSVLSGVAVCGVGIVLLYSRLRALPGPHHHDHEHGAEGHVHDHSHEHEEHAHGHGHHHHLPEGPVTVRTLVALGISGGIVPCPSALVVLLSAVALHRIAYGILLIAAFSIGLASTLIAIGLMVVSGRHWIDRLPSSGPLLQRLPVASAAAITVIGILLIVRALA